MPEKVSAKDRAADLRLRREFGITLEEYRQILKHQDNRCAICKEPANKLTKKGKRSNNLAVDHCHKTGIVRGLLCMMCNRALGKFSDDAQKVINAAAYVTSPPVTEVLGAARFTAPGRIGTKKRAKLLLALKAAQVIKSTLGVYGTNIKRRSAG